jgi:DNA-directed RNA polymerase specialized sigma24 family protein
MLADDDWCNLLETAYRAAREVLGGHDAALDVAADTIEHLLGNERRGRAMPDNVAALARVVAGNLARDRLGATQTRAGGQSRHPPRRSGSLVASRRGRAAVVERRPGRELAVEQVRLFEPVAPGRVDAA